MMEAKTFKKLLVWDFHNELKTFEDGMIYIYSNGITEILTKEENWFYAGSYTIKIEEK